MNFLDSAFVKICAKNFSLFTISSVHSISNFIVIKERTPKTGPFPRNKGKDKLDFKFKYCLVLISVAASGGNSEKSLYFTIFLLSIFCRAQGEVIFAFISAGISGPGYFR
jgi:hypothetical protein